MKYKKRPVEVEAFQYDGDLVSNSGKYYVPAWAISAYEDGTIYFVEDGEMFIRTLEGDHHASVGDYIIKGVKGELYPCKPDIFSLTYEPVESEEFCKNYERVVGGSMQVEPKRLVVCCNTIKQRARDCQACIAKNSSPCVCEGNGSCMNHFDPQEVEILANMLKEYAETGLTPERVVELAHDVVLPCHLCGRRLECVNYDDKLNAYKFIAEDGSCFRVRNYKEKKEV